MVAGSGAAAFGTVGTTGAGGAGTGGVDVCTETDTSCTDSLLSGLFDEEILFICARNGTNIF